MANIGISFFVDSNDPGPTSISNRGGVCTSGDAATGVSPVPGASAIAVVVGVGMIEVAVVVVVEVGEDVRARAGRQSVVILQLVQSKLILPAVEPAVPAMPVNFPEVLIVTPVKGIQPSAEDHA